MNHYRYHSYPPQQSHWSNYNEREHHWQHAPSHHPHAYRRISIIEAMHIAVEQVPGEVVKIELEREKGMLIYEVDIITSQGMKYEVEVDVDTGRIVSVKPD